MSGLYDPFCQKPLDQWSNLRSEPRPVRASNELATHSSGASVATNSPKPVVIVQVRMRLDEQHIQFRTLPHFDASTSPAAGHWREQFKRVLRCLSAPASFSRGPSGRNQIFGAVYRLLRAFPSPRVHDANQSRGSLSQCFENLLGLFGFHNQQSEGAALKCPTNVLNRWTKP